MAGIARKMNQITHDWDEGAYRIPDDAETVRELFSLLEASPTKKADLRRTLTENHRVANVRLRLASGWFHDERVNRPG